MTIPSATTPRRKQSASLHLLLCTDISPYSMACVCSSLQGIDLIAGGRSTRTHRQHAETRNPYILLLIRLYKFLSRRTASKANRIILKRLMMSRVNRPALGIRKLVQFSQAHQNKIITVVGSIVDDPRVIADGSTPFPKLTVAALKVSETARARILAAGGEVITFDQLALRDPTASNTLLLRGPKNARKAVKYFGVPGQPGSHVRPRM